jgi:hypothetical protein
MLQEYEFSGFQGKHIPILSHCTPLFTPHFQRGLR